MMDIRQQVSHFWQQYTIMHLNRRMASIHSNGVCIIYASSFLPYNLYLKKAEDVDARVDNLNNFYHWCSSRILSPDRPLL